LRLRGDRHRFALLDRGQPLCHFVSRGGGAAQKLHHEVGESRRNLPDDTNLRAFLAALWADEVHPPPGCEEWPDLIRRRPGRNERICEEASCHFLEVLPPHYLEN
jgi:hypothetical protein